MPSDTRQARLDGQMARLRGEPLSSNPHPMNTSHSRAYGLGWREIEEKMK